MFIPEIIFMQIFVKKIEVVDVNVEIY